MSETAPLVMSGNKEREDVKLPETWKSVGDLGELTLYQQKISPPCCKLRMIFKWYNVPFKIIDGPKSDSDYKKIPVVVVNGMQINDSFIVVKSLASILDGQPLSPELVAVEEMTTFGLMMALELDVTKSCLEIQKCAPMLDGLMCCGLWSLSCIICCFAPGMISSKNPDLKSLAAYRSLYVKALNGNQFFHGSKPGIVDVSLCGVLSPFVRAGNSCVPEFLGDGGEMFEWYARMSTRLPNVF